jgi:hypothetical protein
MIMPSLRLIIAALRLYNVVSSPLVTAEVVMNTHVMMAQREVKLKPFMQKYHFCQETGASYPHLDQCIHSGSVALHLIDGKVQIETLEALRALSNTNSR